MDKESLIGYTLEMPGGCVFRSWWYRQRDMLKSASGRWDVNGWSYNDEKCTNTHTDT